MKITLSSMGMPVALEITEPGDHSALFDAIFAYLNKVDEQFSTYKETSEVSQINAGKITLSESSAAMKQMLVIAEKTKLESEGYFDIRKNGHLDPSGIVKAWAIQESANMIADAGFHNYCVEIAGDLQTSGHNSAGEEWAIGIRNPFNHEEIIKVIRASNMGVATSGTAARGQHIYDPHNLNKHLTEIVSITVIAPTILDADRFATAAFAMQEKGILFIASQPGLEGYMINKDGIATFTPGFEHYVITPS
jgi:thiamine biosynthesis lipoprotein